jgi:hypothetical protein
MSLKFDKLVSQVKTMGRAIAHKTESLSERGERALQLLKGADDLTELHRKIMLVRDKDAGYRGAAPHTERIDCPYASSQTPDKAIIAAADGSQIYPDYHAAALYYLTNIGVFTYYHGTSELPSEVSEPNLYYADADLRERNGRGSIIKNAVVNARRDVQEIRALGEVCWSLRGEGVPILGLRDGPLLWWLGNDIEHGKTLERDYFNALQVFYEDIHLRCLENHACNASLAGYVDRGDSRFVVRLLHLLTLDDDEITRSTLETAGPFEGLTDDYLFGRFLTPGQRSAVMIQQSPQNRDYKKDLGQPYEITFFYLNVGTWGKANIVRVEIPMWVAESEGAVDEVQSLILSQCAKTGRYPYALMRADELAVIGSLEKRQLEEMIAIELLRNQQEVEVSAKQEGKSQARGKRQRYGQPSKP